MDLATFPAHSLECRAGWMVADSTQAAFVKRESQQEKTTENGYRKKAATGRPAPLHKWVLIHPEGQDPVVTSQLETPPPARRAAVAQSSWAQACPQDPQETGARLIWAPHFAVWY